MHIGVVSHRQAEGPAARKQVHHTLRAPPYPPLQHSRQKRRLAVLRRLQKRTWRRCHTGAAKMLDRRCHRRDHLAIPGQACKTVLPGQLAQSRLQRAIQRFAVTQGHIHPGLGPRDRHAHLALARATQGGKLPQVGKVAIRSGCNR